jgi:hypothetical protein
VKNRIDVVLDTVAVHHVLRQPRRKSGVHRETVLDNHFKSGALRVVLDLSRGLLSEWERTCGREAVGVVLARWEELRGVILVRDVGRIPAAVGRRLLQCGFKGGVDRLVLRISLATVDRVIVSNDSDFWDPKSTASLGDDKAPVVSILRDQLNVTVLLLSALVAQLASD